MEIDLDSPEVQAAIAKAADVKLAEAMSGFEKKLESETEGLKNKNSQLLTEVKKFKARASTVPEDFDPEAYAQLIAENENAREAAAKEAGKWDEYKAELVEKHKAREAELSTQNTTLQEQLESVLVNNEIMSAIAKAKGSSELLMPHVRSQVKLVTDDEGRQVARVIDLAGNPRIAGTSGDYMTIEQLLKEFKESDTYAPCFEGSRATGSGANGSGNGAGGAVDNPFSKETRNLTEQARLLKTDPDAAARLKAAAVT